MAHSLIHVAVQLVDCITRWQQVAQCNNLLVQALKNLSNRLDRMHEHHLSKTERAHQVSLLFAELCRIAGVLSSAAITLELRSLGPDPGSGASKRSPDQRQHPHQPPAYASQSRLGSKAQLHRKSLEKPGPKVGPGSATNSIIHSFIDSFIDLPLGVPQASLSFFLSAHKPGTQWTSSCIRYECTLQWVHNVYYTSKASVSMHERKRS